MRNVKAVAGACGMVIMLAGCSRPDAAPVARSAAPLPSVAMASAGAGAHGTHTPKQVHTALSAVSPVRSAVSSTAKSPNATSARVTPLASVAQKAAPNTFLIECDGSNLVSEPTSFPLACGDGNASLTNMKWSGWGASVAHANGVFVENSCEPNCAQGSPKSYDVTVSADALGSHGNNQVYENLTVTFTGAVPADAEKVTKYPMMH